MNRAGTGFVDTISYREVLHANGRGNALLEFLEDILSSELLEDRTENIEVPVVVIPVGPGQLRPTRRAGRSHTRGLTDHRVVDARSGSEQVEDGRLFFKLGQRGRVVIDPEFVQRLRQIDVTLRDMDSVECVEEALSNGPRLYFAGHVAPLIDYLAGLHNHD